MAFDSRAVSAWAEAARAWSRSSFLWRARGNRAWTPLIFLAGFRGCGPQLRPHDQRRGHDAEQSYDANRLWPTSETYLGPTRPLDGNPSSGSISFSGQEASYNNPATSSSTVITVTGSEGTHQLCQFRRNVWVCTDIPDTGSITVTVNGFPSTATFGDGTTDEDLVSQFATGFTQSGSPVTAFASSNMVILASVATGSAANYPITISTSGMVDFTAGDPNSAMTGGTDGHTGSDTGTMTVSINGTSIGSVNWGGSDTPATLASGISGLIHGAQPSWTVSSSGSTITLQSSAGANVPVTVSVADTAGNTASFSASASGLSGGNGPTGSTNVVYSYGMPAGSYAANGNILSYSDSVNGNWTSITYDGLNRLTGASVSPVAASSQVFCWNYDAFGNRLAQGVAATNPNQSCAPGTAWTLSPVTYDLNNRITTTSFVQSVPSGAYDASGNLGMDVVPSPSGTSNLYSYDAEDRICASQAGSVLTQYIYDAEGHRVAKGTVNAVYIYDPQTQTNKLSCNVSSNGFSETYAYVLGHSGEQMTEIKNGQWQHTNLDIAGGLLATYDVKGLHYQISDWLGSRRVQTDPTGAIEETCTNQPFGDNLQCVTPNGAPVTADDATEHHFTNKERDAESGLDFFGARYYSGGMGRFLNPDWSYKSEAVPYANVGNPQTLNLYAYVGNSPVGRADIDGHIYDGASESVGGSGCSEASACGHNSSIKSFSEIAAQNAAAAYKKVRIAEIFTQRKKETGQQWINRIASSVILSRSAPTSYNVAGYVGIKVDYTVAISGQSNSDILHPLFVTEHQSDHSAALTGHDGMSGGVLHNVFADDVGHRAYATSSSNQTFTVSLHEGINGVGRFGSGPSAPVRVMMNGEIGSGIHIEFNSKGVDETLIPLPTQH